jgi:hypothetical protein
MQCHRPIRFRYRPKSADVIDRQRSAHPYSSSRWSSQAASGTAVWFVLGEGGGVGGHSIPQVLPQRLLTTGHSFALAHHEWQGPFPCAA